MSVAAVMPPVLVTGGAGYIGSHVVLALRDAGVPVVVLDDLSTGHPAALPHDVTLVRGSTGDAERVGDTLRRHRVGAVMHFAASLVVPDSVREPLAYWRNNVANTAILAEACAAAGIRSFVFSSTAAVYGPSDTGSSGAGAGGVDEDAPTLPINPYGSSKLAAERMLADAASAYGTRVATLRYFNVAGADPEGRAGQRTRGATHLVKVACEAASGLRDGIDVYGTDYDTPDGTCVRDFIHVSDLARAHLLALGHLVGGGGSLTLNCGTGRGHSVRDVIASVERLSGRRLAVRLAERRAGDPPALVARAERIRSVLGWRPEFGSLDAIVRSSLDWERIMAGRGRDARRAAGAPLAV